MRRLLILWTFLLLALPAYAETGTTLTPHQQELVAKISQYLNGLKTLKGQFAQISTDGSYAEGEVFLSRPGKMRLIYSPPVKTELIVRSGTIIYHDLEYKQVSYYPLDSTPLGVLLEEELSFEKDVSIVDVAEDAGVIELTLVDREDPAMGSVTLIFSKAPLELRKWAVVDAQGVMTQVSLLGAQFGATIAEEKFDFTDPQYDKRHQ